MELAAEELLNRVSPSDLRSICRKVLNEAADFKEELLSCTQDILTYARNEARKEKSAIVKAACIAVYQLEEEAREMKGMGQCEDWARALYPFLGRIKTLHGRGSLVRGPELAWEALIEVAPLCMYQWDGGDVSAQGFGEEDCDGFHDEVDRLMLIICKDQNQNGKVAWLRNGRKEQIWNLQERPSTLFDDEPCTYRYQETLLFLDKF
jgi:hypothetical protein